MPVHDDLGNRMKEYYEDRAKTYLTRRMPVAIRLDGKAFHTFTKGMKKPFDSVLMETMQDTMLYLCKNIQGCILGYTQSDEITLILQDYKTLTTEAWFNYAVQKMCSISASMAAMIFNKQFKLNVEKYKLEYMSSFVPQSIDLQLKEREYQNTLDKAEEKGAIFDSRVFNIPKEEVTNLIYWRQLDATRNSIQSVGQAYFSHSELQHKDCNDIQDMLMLQKGINWNNYTIPQKRGTCCIKVHEGPEDRGVWKVDQEIPIFVNEGRDYIENILKELENGN